MEVKKILLVLFLILILISCLLVMYNKTKEKFGTPTNILYRGETLYCSKILISSAESTVDYSKINIEVDTNQYSINNIIVSENITHSTVGTFLRVQPSLFSDATEYQNTLYPDYTFTGIDFKYNNRVKEIRIENTNTNLTKNLVLYCYKCITDPDPSSWDSCRKTLVSKVIIPPVGILQIIFLSETGDTKWKHSYSELQCAKSINNCILCKNDKIGGNQCSSCIVGFTGANCDTCSSKFMGQDCNTCSPRFTGINCDTCSSSSTGANCDTCKGNYTGINCDMCSNRFMGQDCNTCNPRFAGINCSTCSLRWTGVNCDTCSPKFTGVGCSVCNVGFMGIDCSTCTVGFTGANCNVCKVGFTGANCSVCTDYHFTGMNCDTCKGNFTGINCDTCSNNSTGVNCDMCKSNFTGVNCNVCKVGFTGVNCNICKVGYTGINCVTTADYILTIFNDTPYTDRNVYVEFHRIDLTFSNGITKSIADVGYGLDDVTYTGEVATYASGNTTRFPLSNLWVTSCHNCTGDFCFLDDECHVGIKNSGSVQPSITFQIKSNYSITNIAVKVRNYAQWFFPSLKPEMINGTTVVLKDKTSIIRTFTIYNNTSAKKTYNFNVITGTITTIV